MGDLENRIERLERLLGAEDDGPWEVPAEWLEINPATGDLVGPPPGTLVSPAEQQALDDFASICASIPYVPE